ncbi:MAG: hypothetical protein AUI14_26340 [Actinobacteria bacterium 13_2_20CM_2_71_6]|nr:MAG: hypothetical protein AUI14_26340 [Actinobacteria bacterium 13_2_20CM_2_71_6]
MVATFPAAARPGPVTLRGGRGRATALWRGATRRARLLLRASLALLLGWLVSTLNPPTTAASWTNATTTIAPTMSTKKVISQAVDLNFMDWYDASDGSVGSRTVSSTQYAGDGHTAGTNQVLNTSFNASYYEQIDYAGIDLPVNVVTSGVTYNITYASQSAGQTTCFYVESRRTTDNTVWGTHGSSGSPSGCVTGTTLTTFNVALTEITNTDTLKDSFAIRMYVYNSGGGKMTLDGNSVTGNLRYNNGTQTYSTFTELEYQRPFNEPAGGGTASWGLGRYNDGTSASGTVAKAGTAVAHSASFDTNKYLEFDQSPGTNFIPTGATITASTLTISYNESDSTGGSVMCLQLDIYVSGVDSGIGTTTGANCASSTSSNVQAAFNTISIISTATQANNVYVRVAPKSTVSDIAKLYVDYIKLTITYSLN